MRDEQLQFAAATQTVSLYREPCLARVLWGGPTKNPAFAGFSMPGWWLGWRATEPTRFARKLRDADLVKTSPWAGNGPSLDPRGICGSLAVDRTRQQQWSDVGV